jgi:hypothetical protein
LIVEAAEDADTDVYASVSVDMPEEYQVTIPKSVTLDGKTKSGTYTVMVSGDLSGEEILSVTPDKTVSMSRDDGASVSGTIVQSKTKWTNDAVGENGKGTISVSDLSAGDWNGRFEFTISTLEREKFEEAITYTDFTLTADNCSMAGITRSGDVVIPETFEYDGVYYRTVEIGNFAFVSCHNITSVVIPDSVTKIGSQAFRYAYNLVSVSIGKSVTSISPSAFNSCLSLENITVADGNPVYMSDGSNAIIEKSTNTLITGCKNTVIPDYVTCIGNYAFCEITSLVNVNIPDSVISIQEGAFYGCNGIISVYIHSGVETIKYRAFYNCNPILSIICGALEKQSGWSNSWNQQSPDNFYSVTYGITRVAYEEYTPFELTADNYEMTGIERSGDVVIPEMFEYNGLKYKVVSIGDKAFYDCSDMTSVQIPESVTKIGSNAFYGCRGLQSIEIPDAVAYIGERAFAYTNIQSMIVAENNPNYDSRDNCNAIINSKTDTLVSGCSSTVVPDSVESIGNGAFYDCTGLTDINLPEGITLIGFDAFNYCGNLTNIQLPNSLTTIYASAFANCRRLTSLNIPDTVTTIGPYMFSNCARLENIHLPDSITSFSSRMFYSCTALKTIYIPSGVSSIPSYEFIGCSSDLKIYCAASEPQTGWAEDWNYYATGKPLSVTYGVTREEYETFYKE